MARKRLTPAEKGATKKPKPAVRKKPPTSEEIHNFSQAVQEEWPAPYTGVINDWLPTGSRLLDLAISGGKGWPGGRIVELYGPEGTGKTLKLCMAIAEAQKRGGFGAVIQAEGRKPEGLMVLTGCVDHPSCWKDYGGDDADTLEKAHDIIEKLVEKKLKYPGPAPLVIGLDSVSVLDGRQGSSEEENVLKGKPKPMLAASLWTRFFKRDVIKAIAGKPIWIFLISHVRDDVGFGGFGIKEDKVSGARVIKHMASTRVRVAEYVLDDKDKKMEKERSTAAAKAPPMGKVIEFKVEKCGTGPPLRLAQLPWFFDHGAIEVLGSWNWLQARGYITAIGTTGRYSCMGLTYTKHDWIHHLLSDTGLAQAFDDYLVTCWMEHNTYPHPYGIASGEEEDQDTIPKLIF